METITHWKNEEIKFLYNNYKVMTIEEISQNLTNRTTSAIQSKLNTELGLTKIHHWTNEDVEIAKILYQEGYDYDYIYKQLKQNHSPFAIKSKLNKIGILNKDYWSVEEDKILNDYYNGMRVNDLLKYFPNRSKESLINRAKKLGIKNAYFWKEEEDCFINNNYNIMSDKEIALELKRTRRSVKWRRNFLGLNRIPKGEFTNISEFLRKKIYRWKQESLKNCNYKCVITGEKIKVIHHLYGFIFIVKETFEQLNIHIKEDVCDYTEEELQKIEKKCLELHYKYGLGVCLCKDVHDLFHKEYGYGYNTPEQFQEFTQRWNNKEFNTLII